MAGVTITGDVAFVKTDGFTGLNQWGDGVNIDPQYAVECENALTVQGVLQPMAQCQRLDGQLAWPIETLAHLHRRWFASQGEKDVIIAASGGQLYWRLPDGQAWQRLPLPPDWPESAYRSNAWSCVTYEINPDKEAPVDVLLMSNALDGMICIRGDDMTVSAVDTPKKFGVIARHAERIWGGAIVDDPDMLVYSAPYDPFNWQQDSQHPEDGAGDILQPSWDGDSFAALVPLGSQLIAMKRSRVWRVLGTNPGEYAFVQQYGGGVQAAATAQADGARILMLGPHGLMTYDGESVAPFAQEQCRHVFARVNALALDKACACLHRGVYYCALPLDGSGVNNAVLRYDTRLGTWLLRTGVTVGAFLSLQDRLYFTSARQPGSLLLWREEQGDAQAMRWVGPWMDLGVPDALKGPFEVWLNVQCDAPAAFTLSLQTQRKTRERRVQVQPSTHGYQLRVRFAGSARRVRFILQGEDGPMWRISGGALICAHIDADQR